MADIESPLLPRRDNLSSSSSSATSRCCCAARAVLLLLLLVSSLSLNFWILFMLSSHYISSTDHYLPTCSFDSFPLVVANKSSSYFSRFNAILSIKNPDRLFPVELTGAVGFPISYHGMQVGFGDMFPVSLARHGAETVKVSGFVYDNDHDVHEMLMEVRDEEVEFRVGFNVTETAWNWLRSVTGDFFTVDCRVKVSGLREGANVTASSCQSRRIKEWSVLSFYGF